MASDGYPTQEADVTAFKAAEEGWVWLTQYNKRHPTSGFEHYYSKHFTQPVPLNSTVSTSPNQYLWTVQ